MPDFHDLPDLVINKIIGLLPFNTAVQTTFLSKQYADAVSALDFKEYENVVLRICDGVPVPNRYDCFVRHNKFFKFLKGYLEYHEKYGKKEAIYTLRLRMSIYSRRDVILIDRWLDRAIHRGLKELDISPHQSSRIDGIIRTELEKMYRLPWVIFAKNNAQSLASLNLYCVRISNVQGAKLQRDKKCLLPSLKTMSFSLVWFDPNALYSLLLECPSIKKLSLTECFFEDFKCRVSSPSLECLELMYCSQLEEFQVQDETKNLESLIYWSQGEPYSTCENVIMNKSFKLKSIDIWTSSESDDIYAYHLPWVKFFSNAKFLTSMTLTCMSIANISVNVQSDEHLLPSLKTLSVRSSWFADKALSSLLSQCPSIEYLSIIGCWFENSECHVSNSSLKSLEVKHCERLKVLQVDDEAKNLESFTFVHPPQPDPNCEKVTLNNTFNLKNIYIFVDELGEFSLNGYHRTLKAKINVQNLHLFDFLGTLTDGFSVKGCQVAKIAVRELWFKNWFVHYSSHFPRLIGCLEEFGCCKKISLYNQHMRALIIPNYVRNEFSSPLPEIHIMEVRMPNPPKKASRDYFDLIDSLQWIAPSAKVEICKSETHPFNLWTLDMCVNGAELIDGSD
ncbi:hypothetical protein ACLB2K_043123 [Fragaria x ananassa]